MTSKFSRPRYTNLTAVSCSVALTLCAGAGVEASRAQTPQSAASSAAAPANARKAHIRFLNMLPAKPANTLVILAGERDSIAAAGPNDVYMDYLPAPVGSYTLVLKRAEQGAPALQRLPVVVPENGFLTVLATEKNGQVSAEVFNDTPDPRVVDLSARIVVRQFCPGAHVKVSAGSGPASQTLDYGATATLENLALNSPVSINIQATADITPPFNRTWTLTGNFSTTHSATLLIFSDPYGRPHPQLSYDAQLHAATPPTAAPPPQ